MAEPILLVLDDEVDFAEFVSQVAEREGFRTVVAATGADFRREVVDRRPDYILLDLNLPDTDGVELLRFLADERSQARIHIVSGMDSKVLDAARRLGRERGLDIIGTLQKPMRADALRTALEAARASRAALTTAELAEALDDDAFGLVYQPKVHLASGRVVGAEALARWEHRTRGAVSPEEFVPFAESTNLIDRLTLNIATTAMIQAKAWRDAGLDLGIAINLSARNLHDLGFADTLADLCRRTGAPADRITLELTETAAMTDALQALDILTRLRLKGFRLSIDDFGQGYSSLVRLQRLPVSEVKIDRALVAEIATSADDLTIVKAMVQLAHTLGLEAVAEGVENEAIAERLREVGCDAGQGYGIARPMAAADLPKWIADWRARRPNS